MLKDDLDLEILRSLTRLFIILVLLSPTRSLFSEKMLISNSWISGLMPNLTKKSWTVSIDWPYGDNYCFINQKVVLTVLLGNYYKHLSPSAVWHIFSAVFLGNLPFFMNKAATTTAEYFVLYFVQTIRNHLISKSTFQKLDACL